MHVGRPRALRGGRGVVARDAREGPARDARDARVAGVTGEGGEPAVNNDRAFVDAFAIGDVPCIAKGRKNIAGKGDVGVPVGPLPAELEVEVRRRSGVDWFAAQAALALGTHARDLEVTDYGDGALEFALDV